MSMEAASGNVGRGPHWGVLGLEGGRSKKERKPERRWGVSLSP